MNKEVLASKQATVAEIQEKAKACKSLTIAEYRGLTVAQIQTLRRALREEKTAVLSYHILRKRHEIAVYNIRPGIKPVHSGSHQINGNVF